MQPLNGLLMKTDSIRCSCKVLRNFSRFFRVRENMLVLALAQGEPVETHEQDFEGHALLLVLGLHAALDDLAAGEPSGN